MPSTLKLNLFCYLRKTCNQPFPGMERSLKKPGRLFGAFDEDHFQLDPFGGGDGEADGIDVVGVHDGIFADDAAGVDVDAFGRTFGVVKDEVHLVAILSNFMKH
jgi:hypothetical protein